MPLDQTTIEQFRTHELIIRASGRGTQPPFRETIIAWSDGLNASPEATQALNRCFTFLEGEGKLRDGIMEIDRTTLFTSIEKNLFPRSRFLLQMIWGYAGDHRGPQRVAAYFNSDSDIVGGYEKYQRVVSDISIGRLPEAFSALCSVEGLSTSFATKVLYFESRNKVDEYALILDDRVAAGLLKITSPFAAESISASAPRPFITQKSGPRARSKQIAFAWHKYWFYVKGLHEVARELGCEAENIELFLFDRGGKPSTKKQARTKANVDNELQSAVADFLAEEGK